MPLQHVDIEYLKEWINHAEKHIAFGEFVEVNTALRDSCRDRLRRDAEDVRANVSDEIDLAPPPHASYGPSDAERWNFCPGANRSDEGEEVRP